MDNKKEKHIDYDESLDEKWDNRELGADAKYAVKVDMEKIADGELISNIMKLNLNQSDIDLEKGTLAGFNKK